MSIFERIDTWVGKTLFVPLIIRVCQWAGTTQYRFARTCRFVAMLAALSFAEGWIAKLFLGAIAALCCIVAALMPSDHPTEASGPGFRLLFWSCLPST